MYYTFAALTLLVRCYERRLVGINPTAAALRCFFLVRSVWLMIIVQKNWLINNSPE